MSSLKFQGIRPSEVKHMANVIWLMTFFMPFLNSNRESISKGPSVIPIVRLRDLASVVFDEPTCFARFHNEIY